MSKMEYPSVEELAKLTNEEYAELQKAYNEQEAADVKRSPKFEKTSPYSVEDISKMSDAELQKAYEEQERYIELRDARAELQIKKEAIDDDFDSSIKRINRVEERINNIEKSLGSFEREPIRKQVMKLPRR